MGFSPFLVGENLPESGNRKTLQEKLLHRVPDSARLVLAKLFYTEFNFSKARFGGFSFF